MTQSSSSSSILFLSEGHDSIAEAAQNANEDIGRGRSVGTKSGGAMQSEQGRMHAASDVVSG